MNDSELSLQIAQLIELSSPEVLAQCANAMHGLAICTDDDVSTLYIVACSSLWAKEHELSDEQWGWQYAWIPVEWPIEVGNSLVLSDRMSALYEASQEDSNGAARRDARFMLLTNALLICRERAIFDPTVFLCVCSTDPSEHMVRLSLQAAGCLNSAEIVQQYQRVVSPQE